MFEFLELEETVGRAWHGLVGSTASYAFHPDHAVALPDVRNRVGVVFRALGGQTGVQIAGAKARNRNHRLGWRQRIGLGDESLDHPDRDDATVFLPEHIGLFPDRALNAALYSWLAAWFALGPRDQINDDDPLRRDLLALRRAAELSRTIVSRLPGLARSYATLSAAMANARPQRPLPRVERDVEQVIMGLLGVAKPEQSALWNEVAGSATIMRKAPRGYRPMLACPLWGDFRIRNASPASTEEDDDERPGGRPGTEADINKQSAIRQRDKETERHAFILNRFEKILAMAEMVDVDRPFDDSQEDDARKAADDLDELAITRRKGRPASKLRFDLDLPPEATDASKLDTGLLYPEWNYRSRSYMQDHCRVVLGVATEAGETWTPDAAMLRRIRHVRRQFEAFRPRHEILRAQPDGHDLDLDAMVRAQCDLRAGTGLVERVHLAMRPQKHDLAVTLLVDVSLSTDAWIGGHRVLDVEKEAILVLAHGLAACGDHHNILTFTSRKRSWVRLETIKSFAEPMSAQIERRIASLRPGYYTRIGAAIRHATTELAKQPQRKKLLIILTDGKPNDVDHYEGRFAIEDTCKAVQEARRLGLSVFGVTVDAAAHSYLPALFGHGGFAAVSNIKRLPAALPALYRQLTL